MIHIVFSSKGSDSSAIHLPEHAMHSVLGTVLKISTRTCSMESCSCFKKFEIKRLQGRHDKPSHI